MSLGGFQSPLKSYQLIGCPIIGHVWTLTESPSVCRLATCSVTRSSAHLASVKCSFLHHCPSLSSLSPSSRICNSRACVYKICLPYCYHYLPNSVFPSLFFGRLFVALLTNRKSFLFSQSFLATQSMCVLSSPFLKKLGGRESRELQTSWGFGWLLHIFPQPFSLSSRLDLFLRLGFFFQIIFF